MPAPICFTMDNLSDAADLGRGRISFPRSPGNRPALEKGFPAMLAMFRKYQVSITHFIEGWNGEAHPEELKTLLEHGHTLGMHGWQHEKWSELDDNRAYELALQSTIALEKGAGIRPRAFRAPGGANTEFTQKVLANLGYHIDASLHPDGNDGGEIQEVRDGLWNIPYEWAAVDATHWLWEDKSIEEVETLWNSMLDDAAVSGEPLVFIWHAHIMGIEAERLEVGDRILQRVTSDDQFQIASLEDLTQLGN